MKLILTIALASTITATGYGQDLSSHIAKINPTLKKEQVKVIAAELKRYPRIMTYIVQRESTFNPVASDKGCIGLAGVNVKVWTKTLIKKGIIKRQSDLRTVKYNLKAGWYILKHYNMSYKRYRGIQCQNTSSRYK